MKIINLIIVVLLVLFVNNNIAANGQSTTTTTTTTTTFIPSTECFTSQGCSIFSNSSYWDNQVAFNNSKYSNFLINFQNNQTATLLIDNDFDVNGLTIDFSELVTPNSVIINSATLQANNIQFVFVSSLVLNASSVVTQTISIIGTAAQLKSKSMLITTSATSSNLLPDFVLNDLSILSVYDTSSIKANYILLQGILLLSDSSTADILNDMKSELGIVASPDSMINCVGTMTLDGTQKHSLSGFIKSNTIDIENSVTVSISNTTTSNLYIKSSSTLTTSPWSIVKVTDNISIDGNLVLGVNSIFIAQSESLQTVGGIVTLNSNTNFNIGNLEFPDGSIVSNTSQIKGIYSNITVLSNTIVKILGNFNQDERIFGGITVASNGTFYAMDQLSLEGCIYVYGHAQISVSVICYNDNMFIYDSGSVDFLPNTNSYIYKIYNEGIIDIDGSNVTLHSNIINNGELNLAVDGNLNLLGFMDCLSSSAIDIQGLGPNTAMPALKVRDILTMDGTLFYNISNPPKDQDSVYLFIQSEIQLDGNFTTFLPSDYLTVDVVFTFLTPKGYNYPDTLEVVFNNYKEPHHIHPILILISIVSPLIVIGFLVLIVYKVKQYKQLKGYTPLNSNDKILNDSSQHL